MAETKQFKYIKGKYSQGCPADICFYTDVEAWSVEDFLYEFSYLVNYVNPSKIRIHINSCGGSVVDGMSVFAKIQDCPIPTETINDCLAASMGSVIWAAADEMFMKDYALLMIHNPFTGSESDKQYNQVTEAFTKQLRIVYMKRFGLSEEEVTKIMDGEEGNDGTFMTAEEAVEKGFIKADHIIETPKGIKDKVRAALNGVKDIAKIKAVFGLIGDGESAQSAPGKSTEKQNTNTNSTTMEEKQISVIAALLGMTGDKATAENVTAKINELQAEAGKLVAVQKDLDNTKAALEKANAELAGAQTSVKNLTADLESVKAELKVFQDAEAKAKEERIAALIDKAVAECKINKEERELYTKMAQSDYDLAENVLAKIPARADLGREVAKGNTPAAQSGLKSDDEKNAEKVKAVVGENFKFRTLA